MCVCVCEWCVIYHTGNNGVASAELPKVYRACLSSRKFIPRYRTLGFNSEI